MQTYYNKKKQQLTILYGSKSHHFNQRRLKKVQSKYFIPLDIPKSVDKKFHQQMKKYPNGNDGTYHTVATKHRLQFCYQSFSNSKDDQKISKEILSASKALDDSKGNDASNENVYIDMLYDAINYIIKHLTPMSVDDFINLMFGKLDTIVHTRDLHNQPLKFWELAKLDGKHPYHVNMAWFSKMYDRHPAYSAKNMKHCLRTGSLKRIRLHESWLPVINDYNSTVFVFWGMHGAHQKQAQQYLYHKYHIIPLDDHISIKHLSTLLANVKSSKDNHISFSSQHAKHVPSDYGHMANQYHHYTVKYSLCLPYKKIKLFKKHFPDVIYPICLLLHNQRTYYRQMVKHHYNWKTIKANLKDNWKIIDNNTQLNKLVDHSAVIHSNLPKRLQNGLDWVMQNKTNMVNVYQECYDTDSETNNFGINDIKRLAKILGTY